MKIIYGRMEEKIKMTKSELIEGLKDLDDDAEVHVYCTSFDMPSGGQYAYDIYFDDKVTGPDVENEITIVAHF